MHSLFSPVSFSSFLLFSSHAWAAPAGQHQNKGVKAAAAAPRAIYFISNNAGANSVAALPVSKNGSISTGTMTPTGGAGASEVDPKTRLPNSPDALSSQGAVRVVGNFLFAVNAGSSTLSMFSIGANDPTKLTMIGQPQSTNGDFPVSLGVSMKNSLACVGNSGAKAGISCASVCPSGGLGTFDALRPFELNQTTPPSGPLQTVADVFFSEDEKKLITTVKGDPTLSPPFPGFMSIFPVMKSANASVLGGSATEARSNPNGTAVLFGSVPIPGTADLLVTDASFGAAVMAVDGKSSAGTVKHSLKIAGQGATCWVTISPKTKSAYVTDVAVNRLIEMDTKSGTQLGAPVAGASVNFGMTDLIAGGNFIYALSPGKEGNRTSAVQVFDVSAGKGKARFVQNLDVSSMGIGVAAQGMQMIA